MPRNIYVMPNETVSFSVSFSPLMTGVFTELMNGGLHPVKALLRP